MDVNKRLKDFFSMSYENYIHNSIDNQPNFVKSFPWQEVEEYVSEICSIPYSEFLEYLSSNPPLHSYSPADITQSSKLYNCHVGFCNVYRQSGLFCGFNTKELGELLQRGTKHSAKENSLSRYGRDQSATAKQLGLCRFVKKKWYLTCLGLVFLNLSPQQRNELMARTILRDALYSKLLYKAQFEDVILESWMTDLSSSTIVRRSGYVMNILKIATSVANPGTFHNFILPSKNKK